MTRPPLAVPRTPTPTTPPLAMTTLLLPHAIAHAPQFVDADHHRLCPVGIIYVGALIAKLFTYTIAWVRPGRKLRKYGQWAVVTGATDGIGKGVCTRVPLPPS